MVYGASRFEVSDWTDNGLTGVIKRYRQRREDDLKRSFADKVLSQNENLDAEYVEIDGTRYYRKHRTSRYRVRLGGSTQGYYSMKGNEVPIKRAVIDTKGNVKREEISRESR